MKRKILKAFKIVFVLILLFSSNNIFGSSNVSAQSNPKFPKLGVSQLKDDEGFESVDLLTNLFHKIQSKEPSKSFEYEKPINGFYLLFDNPGDFEKITFQVTRSDNTKTDILRLDPADSFFGDENINTASTRTSSLYTFPRKVKSIDFFYEEEINFSVIEIKTDIAEQPVKPQNFASTSAERAYKEKLFSEMGFNIIAREEWGAPTTSTWIPSYSNINRIVVHHTATGIDLNNPSNTVKSIYNFHYHRCADNSGSYNPTNPQPNCDELHEWWQDIGYNYLIDPHGNIYEGRAGGNGSRGAHAVPNSGSIGISILGTYTNQEPTQASMEALTKLTSALTLVNDFDAVWHGGNPSTDTGMYGHRDLLATACPGNKLYPKLNTIATLAIQMKPSYDKVKDVHSKTKALLENRDYQIDEGKVRLMLNIENSSALIKEKLLTTSRRVEKIVQKDDTLFYWIDPPIVSQLISEISLIAPETKVQPLYIYKLQDWDNTSPTRSIPSDYNTSTHWNLEKVKAPEGWKNLGGCSEGSSSCGGDNDIVVAVIDTGVAYENFNYDAGDDDSYTVVKIGGLHHEYPTDSTQDGTFVNGSYKGLERNYQVSPELNGVNFVTPYDAVQDYFCFLRTLDGSSANNCNSHELAKINHANDDHGHGTFVSTIIAANTGNLASPTSNRVVGIAHNLSIMPIKVFFPNDRSMCQNSSGNLDLNCSNPNFDYRVAGDSFIITQGIYHAIENEADVINLSLSGFGTDPVMEAAINTAVSQGIVVVAAAGNNNTNIGNVFPASFANVIAVGATAENNTRASYSNFGSQLDLVAPVGGNTGAKIASQAYSCYPGVNDCSDESDKFLFSNEDNPDPINSSAFTSSETPITDIGTSFAAPQVSALAGMILSVNPNLAPYQVRNLMFRNTTDVNAVGYDTQTGWGIINFDKTLGTVMDGFSPQSWFTSCAGCWDPNRTDFLLKGDFNNDGLEDFATMYKYGQSSIGLWVFKSNGTSFTPENWFQCNHCWDTTRAKHMVSGDFNNDGATDIAAMYDYGNSSSSLWVFESNGSNAFTPRSWFSTCAGCWNSALMNSLTAGDYDGDGADDIATMYDYGNSTTSMWVFKSNGTNRFSPEKWYTTCAGCWNPSLMKSLVSGDYNNDGQDDIATMYHYGNNTIRLWVFKSLISNKFSPETWYASCSGCWNPSLNRELVSGDFNNDQADDLATIYDYNNSSIQIWSFLSNGTNTFNAKATFYCAHNCWDFNRAPLLVSGKFDSDDFSDLASIYHYGGHTVRAWVFRHNTYP